MNLLILLNIINFINVLFINNSYIWNAHSSNIFIYFFSLWNNLF